MTDNDYAKAVGVWEHKLGNIEHNLKLTKEDNLTFLNVRKNADKANDEAVLFAGLAELYVNAVLRDYPEIMNDEKRLKDLKEWVGLNIAQISKDLMVALGWTTKEKLEALEKGDFLSRQNIRTT